MILRSNIDRLKYNRTHHISLCAVTGLVLFIGVFYEEVEAFSISSPRTSQPSYVYTCPRRPEFTSPSSSLSTCLRALLDDDDDEDEADDTEDPLADGIDSVAWLEPLDTMDPKRSSTTEHRPDAEVIPLFPLGGIVYTPNSEHILNIFEPRYRQMYSDILMNGSKRFAVSMSHPNENGRFAAMGVLFELEDLKEVSEQTGDQIKFICNHKVTGRVKMHRVLNPEAWSTRETYLRVEATILDDSGKDQVEEEAEAPKEQKLLRESFSDMVEVQHQLSEDVRFTRSSVLTMGVKPGAGEDGLWQTIKLWQTFVDQRLMARQNELQRDFQDKLQEYLRNEKGLSQDEMPRYDETSKLRTKYSETNPFSLSLASAVGFQDLPNDLQKEVLDLQKSMAVELQPLVLESQLTMQKVLECPDHVSRLKLVRTFIDAEAKRLRTKKALKGMFAAPTTTEKEAKKDPAPEMTSEPTDSPPSSFFVDDGDAFQ